MKINKSTQPSLHLQNFVPTFALTFNNKLDELNVLRLF